MSVNDKYEVIEGQFQVPPKVFQSMFGSTMKLSVDIIIMRQAAHLQKSMIQTPWRS